MNLSRSPHFDPATMRTTTSRDTSAPTLNTQCPRDTRFLPTIPEEYMNLRFPVQSNAAADQSGQVGPVHVAASLPAI